MRINIGTAERALRLVLGIGLVLLALLAGLSPAWSGAAALAGLVLLATAALRFCPVWALPGITRGLEGGGREAGDRGNGDRQDGDHQDGGGA
ncbi:YgaP-like transmembrane domain [Paracoccus sp. P2]|uniref:DUF2892 domain-containing protein n=1 Tax=Paracoccus pantotrophus TaxID=82367 RepID=A0A1I5MW79_PARPN|nr:YgaP-like transmembrane domain [Paracoccus pantotrophus]MDF3856643.1 DUF2892 domain-containing protein [Paracoccus pantotrophus]QFG36282.1 DUF2892 domain-containing protein [Paracoccus pantotrophus]QLH13144.1 DUF2892 domain-containing protein [Paracoccus pantotrophus]QLH16588.1 DUF2892 domain-containing protein [Paracoccus pantotrophus]RKS43138.1 hypothetical protein BDE18_4085 [Paracoccus pantotrophus]